MPEINTELARRLITGRKRDGRCTYDPQAKAEIVQACLQPGASVTRIGMQYGINANLLRTWMGERHVTTPARSTVAVKRAAPDAQFIALQIETSPTLPLAKQAVMMRVHVRLPNSMEFDLSETSPE